MEELIQKIQDNLDGANILIESGLNKQAAPLLWNAVRSAVFFHLKEIEESYSSSKEALIKIVLIHKDDNYLCSNIICIETVALLCEWDEYFSISESQVKSLKDICTDIVSKFISTIQKNNKQALYTVYEEEIKRHLEDSEAARSTQFEAAVRNEKKYDNWLTISFLMTIIGVSAFFYTLLNMDCISKISILGGQFLALAAAGCTFWSLIQNYQGKAVAHRQCAEEYSKIWKKCRNWKTDFPDEENMPDAKKYVHSIRDSVNTTNYFSPPALYIDYKKGKKDRESGSYDYSTKKIQNK